MAKFGADQADNYGGQGGTGFFSLKNDGDVTKVRFMYSGMEDVNGVAVHEVNVNDKKRYINCLREYGQPLDSCPMCAAKYFQAAKLFVPIYDVQEGTVKYWERGKKFFGKMSSLCSRYSNLVSHIFEIERHGKKGDTATTYEIYECGQDNTTLEDLPEAQEVIGSIVLDKTAEEMSYYLQNGVFPNDGNETSPSRRRVQDNVDEEDLPFNRRDSRRTPTNTTGRRNGF